MYWSLVLFQTTLKALLCSLLQICSGKCSLRGHYHNQSLQELHYCGDTAAQHCTWPVNQSLYQKQKLKGLWPCWAFHLLKMKMKTENFCNKHQLKAVTLKAWKNISKEDTKQLVLLKPVPSDDFASNAKSGAKAAIILTYRKYIWPS